MKKALLCFLLGLLPMFILAQKTLSGEVVDDRTGEPLPYASIIQDGTGEIKQTQLDGTFKVSKTSNLQNLIFSYVGYLPKKVKIEKGKSEYRIRLEQKPQKLKRVLLKSTGQLANRIIKKVIAHKNQNDPDLKFDTYQYQSYRKLIIDDQKELLNINLDTAKAAVGTVLKKGRAYLSEQVTDYKFKKGKGIKETVKATRTAGFKKPVYEILALKTQSTSWYKEKYTVFGTDYAGPLAKDPFSNYAYKVLDTVKTGRPAYVVYFQPKRQQAVAGLEGVLYIDMANFGLQKAVGELRGEIDVTATQDFRYYPTKDLWFPQRRTFTIKPGSTGKKVSIFGGNISLGSLPETNKKNKGSEKLFLRSVATNREIKFNQSLELLKYKNSITILPDAISKPESYWRKNRTLPFTQRDQATFARVDSIIKNENINRKIDVIQKFNNGYFPVGFFDIDLRTLIKYNNYEGLRLGAGGVTNEKLSKRFRLEGYGVYGFKDSKFKYSIGGGISLNKPTNTWLNINYTDDITEVGSFTYLTDLLVYSLFEPRLVNINFYYKHQTLSSSLQHRFMPGLISEWKLSKSDIQQTNTKDYQFLNHGKLYSDYQITKATVSLRWSPFSKFLVAPAGKVIETQKSYPKFSFQATQAFNGFLNGDFDFTKLGAKVDYTIDRINQTQTKILLEGDYAFGDLPLTHSFHTYPNQPQKPTISGRFSVAGRRSFETMYFSEFFSDKLATLQIKHRLRPFDFGRKFKPEMVLITRHAIGDMSDSEKHKGIDFKTLNKGYSESGFEINKILYGFGLSFAYRYGAYHLPDFEDNIALKFTFYLKL